MKKVKIALSAFLTLFGALSVFMTLSIIFDLFGIREKEGNYVLFIVYANLACGLIYLSASYQLWHNVKLSFANLTAAALILIIAFIFLQIHISNGGIYELKTVKAMTFRTSITIVMAAVNYWILKKKQN